MPLRSPLLFILSFALVLAGFDEAPAIAQSPLTLGTNRTEANEGPGATALGSSSTTNRTYRLDPLQTGSPVQFLTPGQTEAQLLSGAIDAEPSIAAALVAGPVRLPCGSYRLDQQLAFTSHSRVILDGGGPGCVSLNINFPSGDVIYASDTSRLRIEHLAIGIYPGATLPRTSGAVFHLKATYDAELSDIVVTGPQYGDAFLVDGANTTRISRFDCRPPVTPGVGSFGAGACIHGTGNFADLFFENGNSANYHYGLELTHGSGVYASRADFVESGTAVEFDPSFGASPPQSVFGVNLSGIFADTSQGDNILFEGDGWITDIQLIAPWSSNSQSASGITTSNPRLDGLQLISPTILGNHAIGLNIQRGTHISGTDVHSFLNSRAGANLWDDIYIGAAQSNIISIAGAQVGTGGTFASSGATPYSRYGINVAGNNPSGQTITIRDLVALGNLTGNCKIPPNNPPYAVSVSGSNCRTPWSASSATVTATAGSLRTASGNVRWIKDGTKVDANVVVSITANGTGAGGITISMPFQNGPSIAVFSGKDILTGKAISGTMNAASKTMMIKFYDNSYPGATGAALVLNGVCETSS